MVEERRDRPRRVNALLNAYYSIEGASDRESARPRVCSDLDRQGFDAKRYFDSMVAAGQLPDLVRRAKDLDSEVKDLDSEMQKLVYENYTQFTRAAAVISRMKVCIETLEPDMKRLEGNMARMAQFQDAAESGVWERSAQLEATLRRQRLCKKLEVLFGLPALLQRCLDCGEYGPAAQAYRSCAPLLRQFRNTPALADVHRQVEGQLALVRGALEERLRSPELPVGEALRGAEILLGLGEDHAHVLREYLAGRAAALRGRLDRCFLPPLEAEQEPAPHDARSSAPSAGSRPAAAINGAAGEAENGEHAEGEDEPAEPPPPTKQELDLLRPESRALQFACASAADRYVPGLRETVEGLLQLQESGSSSSSTAGGSAPSGGGLVDEAALADFVSARVGDLFGEISRLVGRKCPPTKVLVDCLHGVCDALRQLPPRLARTLPRLFAQLLNGIALSAMDALFSDAAAATVAELLRLHAACLPVEVLPDAGQSDILEAIGKTEHALIMHGFTALTDCQPLLGLLQGDQAAAVQFLRRLHNQLACFFLAFTDACHLYIGQDPEAARASVLSPPPLPRAAAQELAGVAKLGWNGLYGLVLVRMARHLEVKVITKVWSVAKDVFASNSSSHELAPHPAVIKAARNAAQAVISHYALVAGQGLARHFRDAVQSRDWQVLPEPRGPLLLAQVVKDMHRWDNQLAHVLGDPRKDRGSERRKKSRFKTAMELEMERLWAKKLQTFAPAPFNRNGVVVGILRIAFKALYEYAREATFAKFGLQQLQVDCAFLAAFVQEFAEAEDAGILESLLNEVLTSASARCVEPILMDASIVEALCEDRKRELRPE